jgi:cysteine desulfuration protein SufE
MSTAAAKLDQVAQEFADLEPRERLQLLGEFVDRLPPLPERFRADLKRRDHRVHECVTPVYLWVEVIDDRVQIFGAVDSEAPLVQGFLSLLIEIFSGSSREELLAMQPDLLQRFGIGEAVGMQRAQGLPAIFRHIQKQVRTADVA